MNYRTDFFRYVCNATAVCVLSIAFAPLVDAGTRTDIIELQAQQQAILERLRTIENSADNQGLIEMAQTLEQLRLELQTMHGEIETLRNDIQGLRERQRVLYSDIDRRLNDLQLAAAPVAAVTPPADTTATPSSEAATVPVVNPETERADYKAAFTLLRDGRYAQAIDAFNAFLADYPQSSYADNAQYWLGEAHYVLRQFDQAVTEFTKVLEQYAGSLKIPDAKLKLGYTYYELKRWDEARKILDDLLQTHSKSSAAQLAEKRLQRMTEEGH